MKGFAMLGMGKTGWIEKARPVCGALDAIVRPIAVSPCTSDVHTVWEGALGERKDLILGHEAVGEVVEVGSLVRDFAPGDRVRHAAFGKGMVLSVRPMGGDALVEVAFDKVGTKKLMLKAAGVHLTKL